MFNEKDIIHLANMMELIRDKLVLTNLDCMGVSKAYKAFEWMQDLEEKFIESEKAMDELKYQLANCVDEIEVRDHCVERLQAELREEKEKTTKKPTKKKKK